MTNTLRVLIVVVALAAAHSAVAGAGANAPRAAVDCENAVSTVDMNACAQAELDRADVALNAAYKAALADIPEMASEAPYDAKGWEAALRASQRAWVAFRDAECNDHVAMFWTGGTGATADILGCMTTKTEERTKELTERYAAP